MSRTITRWAVGAAFLGACALFTTAAAAQDAAEGAPRFRVVDLGPGTPLRVNDHRQVVGISSGLRPFLWTEEGGQRDLGNTPGGGGGGAYAINNRGVVVGTGDEAPFMWDEAGGMRRLAALDAVPGHKTANDVNERGQIVGWIHHDGEARAYRLDPDGALTILGDLPGGRTYAGSYMINDRGEIVGHGNSADGRRGWFWSESTGMVEIPPFSPGGSTNFGAINNHGVVAGIANVNGQQQDLPGSFAFTWTLDGGLHRLAALPGASHSTAAGINDHGEIAGYGNGDGVADLVGVYWDRGGTPWNLDEVTGAAGQGWHFQQAFGINDHGDVIGWGVHDGAHRGFLLVHENPEPGALGMIVVCAGALLGRRRHG
jgi:uncharacterized membrane protein